MNVKLEDIRYQHPCESGWKKLIRSLNGRTEGNVSLSHILGNNGIEDAVWCLRTLPYRDQCLFRADVAELVVHLCNDEKPRQAIDAIRQWHKREINDKELAYASDVAAAVLSDASDAAAYAGYAAFATFSDFAASSASRASADPAHTWLKITNLFQKYYCEDME